MKIVKIVGGLGNQMFQYAFLLTLRESSGDEVLMDTSVFDTYKLHNGFELERVFNISARKATKEELKRLTRYTTSYTLYRIYKKLFPALRTECREKNFCDYDLTIFEDYKKLYYDGYWQNYQYFDKYEKQIREEFTFKMPLDKKSEHLLLDIQNEKKCVSLHIRRGDYLKHKLYKGLCDLTYYQTAIDYVIKKHGEDVRFILFSNDITWCNQYIRPLLGDLELVVVDWNGGRDSYRDMQLMCSCSINVIANSSFSWWAAYLNEQKDKEVIAPKKWINSSVNFQIQMPDWTLF
ncbi:MAG: alpha-1,2-fucosyltransferase [Bacteroidaceae bacterium]